MQPDTTGTATDGLETRDWTMIEVARAKGVAYQTVWRAISRGQLPARRVGRTVLVPAEAVAAWHPCYERVPRRFRDQPRTPRPRSRPAAPHRALVADDELAIRDLLTRIIEGEGFEVVSVADGEAAVAAARRTPFSHVFLDVRMPLRDGATLVPAIRESSPNAVIAFVTAYPTDLAKVEWPAAWPIVVIAKPFDLNQILAVLRMSLGGRPRQRSRPWQASRAAT